MQEDTNTQLLEGGFVRLHQILSIIPISKSSWWAGVKDGRYPPSYKLGRCTFWKSEDIRKLIQTIDESSVQGGSHE